MDADPSLGQLLLRGARRQCPRCGAGRLFLTWFRMVDRCPGCAFRLEREEGFFVGAYFINFCFMELVLGIWIGTAYAITLPDAPVAGIVAGGVVIATVVPMLGYPFSKTLWAALHLSMAPSEPEEEADAAAFRFQRGDAGERS